MGVFSAVMVKIVSHVAILILGKFVQRSGKLPRILKGKEGGDNYGVGDSFQKICTWKIFKKILLILSTGGDPFKVVFFYNKEFSFVDREIAQDFHCNFNVFSFSQTVNHMN